MKPLISRLQGRRNRKAPEAEPSAAVADLPETDPLDTAAVQIMAHTLISSLFGAGMRMQSLAARAPEDLQADIAEVADQIDKVITELRSFAFTHRA